MSAQTARAAKSPSYAAVLQRYKDQDWRLNNLYFVLDEQGNRVRYQRRPAQQAYADAAWVLDVIVKARQLGFSTEIGMEMLDQCVFRKNQSCGIIDLTLGDAKKKLEKLKFAYANLPEEIRRVVRMTKDNEDEIRFSNGSSIMVGTSHRGGTLQFLHISEFGKKAAVDPKGAREIINGAFNTVVPGCKIKIESTAHGIGGEFYEIVEKAQAAAAERRRLSALEFKLHFFAWHADPKYRLPINAIVISQEMNAYFALLQAKHGIQLDGEQRAFYAAKAKSIGADAIKSEFPSVIDECFFNSLEGTFFKAEMTAMRADRRLGKVPHDPTRRVHTMWDKGMNELSDQNAVIFFQTDGVRHRVIDYYENAGEGLRHYVEKVEEIGRRRGFLYGRHYGPHDLEHRQYVDDDAMTIAERAKKNLGFEFTIVPRVLDKDDSIEAARSFLAMAWIDEEHCERLVKCLDNYRKQWNDKLAQWTSKPLHNWASNAADALQTGAVGIKPEHERPRQAGRSHSKNQERRGSHWSA